MRYTGCPSTSRTLVGLTLISSVPPTTLPTSAWLNKWNIVNQSQPNQGPRPVVSPCTLANPCTVPVDGVAERLVHVDGDRVADAHEEVDEEAVLLLGDLLQGGHELRREAEAPVRGGARHSRHVAVPVWRLGGTGVHISKCIYIKDSIFFVHI